MITATWLAFLAITWWAGIWAVCLLGWNIARNKYGLADTTDSPHNPDAPSNTPSSDAPGVSILRPLRGLDANLFENLESTFVQRYPHNKVEVICSVAREDDQAIGIVRSLMESYPNVDAKLLIGEEVVGINPKINNLVRSYRTAKYDTLWILDSNVQVSPDALGRSIAAFTPSPPPARPIGLVHHVPFPVLPDITMGSRMEQAFLSTTHAKMYIAINATSIDSCVMGKSCLFRKSDFERAVEIRQSRTRRGSPASIQSLPEKDRLGIAAFNEYLGEDNMIGHAIWHEGGMRHAIAPDVAASAVGTMSFEQYFWRRVRWIRVRKYMVVLSTLVEPCTESFLCGMIGASGIRYFLPIPVVLFLIIHIVLWYSVDVSVYRSLNAASPVKPLHNPWHDGPGSKGQFFRPAFIQAWMTRELCALPIWLFAMLGNSVAWREDSKKYRVRMDGKVVADSSSCTQTDWIDALAQAAFRRSRERSHAKLRKRAVESTETSKP